jgi:hypothetical protein
MIRETTAQELADLRQKLADYFDDGELKSLCFDLGVAYDELPGEGKVNKARELIAFMERRDRIAELVAECARQRPKVSWKLSLDGDDAAASNDRRDQQRAVREASGSIPLPGRAAGDVIVAQIGAGAENVAVGKNVTQSIGTLGEPDDRQVIGQRLAEVAAALDKVRGQGGADIAAVADFQIKLLRGELEKTARGETPSANVITQVGDWLLGNWPQMTPALASLFAAPAVSKVVARAGSSAVNWVKARFGQ